MPLRLTGPRVANGSPLRAAIEIADASPLRVCFKQKEWNDIKRTALHEAGMDFVVGLLPLRFTKYAYRLGYFISDKSLVQKALNAGVTPNIMTEIGLVRWNSEKGMFEIPNIDRLLQLYYAKVRAGEIKNNRESRKRFFAEFKRNLRRRLLRDRQSNVSQANLLPLVDGSHTGQPRMRETATTAARVVARATNNSSHLEVRIPFGHPVQPSVSNVMQSVLPEENERVARKLARTVDALLRGASVHTVKRGVTAGQLKMHLTPEQRSTIAHTQPQRPRLRSNPRKSA